MIELLKNSWHGHTQDSEFCGPDSRELYQANLRRLAELVELFELACAARA